MHWVDADQEWELLLSYMAPGMGDLTTTQREQLIAEKGKHEVVLYTEIVRAKVVISAVGALVEPKPHPDIPGLKDFQGDIIHSACWDRNTNVKDKNVIVVGTGSTGGQIVPALITPQYGAKSVTHLMRSPPWVEPTMTAKGLKSWEKWMPKLCGNVPGFQRVMRKIIFTTLEIEFLSIFSPGKASRRRREERAKYLLGYLRDTVPEKYWDMLTPDYEVFCKRRVIDAGWFTSLQDDRVELSTLPLTKINQRSVTLGPGRSYPPMEKTESKVPLDEREVPADTIIFANGFEAGEWLHPLDVIGRHGQGLHKTWQERGGAQAYLGSAMDGFPNFFIIHGPNTVTGHSSVILASEMMIQYALHFVPRILKGEIISCEVTEEAERKWTKDIQERLQNSVWMSGGCHSWYFKGNWNATLYP